ncbi:MAG: hypothetical protein Q7S30_01935 [Candidatus Omnitrophota bacterium]|nr:hypothetical protein [Candidatus Omnitrophota bacterium]
MKRAFTFIAAIIFLFIYTSMVFAWSDDVEGMMMPSARGEDRASDPETILESIETPADAPSADSSPTIKWE